ncbi:MAG: EamA family transporter [Rhodospirillaceae bacterium]|nr:MAG: EamA family transporter [Rhodospirillaceae bacterium]
MSIPTNKYAYFALVLAFVLLWSSSFAAAKITIQYGPPLILLGSRFIIAGLMMIGYAVVTKTYRPVGAEGWAKLTILGLLNQVGYQGIAWMGMASGAVSSGLVAVIISMNPILIALFAVPMFGEHMSLRRGAGLALGIVGVVIVLNSRITVTGEDVFGTSMLSIALLSMVLGSLYFKKWKMDIPLSVAIGGHLLTSGVILVIYSAFTEDLSTIIWGLPLALSMAYIIIGATIGGVGLWFFLLSHGNASDASALHFLMPPFGLMYGWVLLSEPVAIGDLLGIIPIGLGIWLATHKGKAKSTT